MKNGPVLFTRLLGVVAVLLLFGAIMVAAGHGAGPIGLLLVLGRAVEWVPGQIFGWFGVLLCLASVFREGSRSFLGTLLWGLILLIMSALAFAYASEATNYTLAFSLPLVGATLFVYSRFRKQQHAA